MNAIIIPLLIAGLIAAFLTASEAVASPIKKTSLDLIFRQAGAKHGVDWRLLKAIATVESSLNPTAINKADPSVGLMQLLAVGWPNHITNKLPAIPNWPPDNPKQLFDPVYNVDIGAQIINWNINKFGLNKGIAVYNSWSERNTPPGHKFGNQRYVDKVLSNYRKLQNA